MSKKKNLPFVIIVLLICFFVILGGILSIFYLTESFPTYNAKIDAILAGTLKKDTIETTQTDVMPDDALQIDELLEPIVIDGINTAQLIPYFSMDFSVENEKIPNLALSNKGNTFSEYGLDFSFFDDRYSLKSSGIFERLRSNYTGEVYSESTWEYHGEFPIISQPSLFADSLVFIDAKPQLVQLDLQMGLLLNTMPSPAYPSEIAGIVDQNSYVFAGRDGKTYAFEFLNSAQIEQKNRESNFASPEYRAISNLLAYNEKTITVLQDSLNSWMDTPVTFNLHFPLILSDTQAPQLITLKIAEPLVFAYAPQEQGTYTIGLCDENGRWITAQGFSAVFTGQGDLQSVSIDYVADKPQTTIHLASNEFYYITVGLFPTRGTSEIPDSDEAVDGKTTATSYFIMVKKTS